MSLAVGTRIGPYEVLSPLGAGGMGEVYHARDTKLNRDVAIKILPDAFASDADRVARFTREAQTLATLNHPNIAQIHGLEASAGVRALVMELVEGEDLAQRIARGPIPIEEALAIARQIADGLEAAHDKGIVHRDLKPANIKLTPDGVVKVLDFGLAKALGPAGSNSARTESPTITSPAATHAGVILGTAAYMSPEQARGKAVDKRADIWAFGCVLYEMLAGRPAFQGETVSELLAAVMRDTPPLDALAASIGSGPRQLVARCLQKDPKDRLRDIGDARWYLDEQAAQPNGIYHAPRHTWRERLVLPLAAVAAVAVGAALWGWLRPLPPLQALRRVIVPTPELSRITSPTLAPTGDRVAFVGDGRLWIQLLAERTARSIPNSDGAAHPFWSPDGGRLGYFVGTRVFTVGVDAGASTPLTEIESSCRIGFPCGGAWTDDGRILLTSSFGNVFATSDRGGPPRPYLTARDGEHFHEVSALPGGRGALVTVDPDVGVNHVIVWDGGERRTLLSPADRAVYSPSGHVIVSRGESLWAVPFSLSTMTATGEPFLISEAAGEASVARDGALLYTARGRREQQLVWVDRSGAIGETVGTYEGSAFEADISPDGRRVAFVSAAGGHPQIWVLEPARGTRTPLVREPFVHVEPVWSADGASVFYASHPPGQLDIEHRSIRTARPGGVMSSVVVERGHEPSVSLDGRHLVFSVGDIGRSALHHIALDHVAASSNAFLPLGISGGSARLSPDGRFVAYMQNDATGRFEIYLSSFPKPSAGAQVSRGGLSYRTAIRWSATGDRLYYVRTSDGALIEVDVRLEPSVRLAEPRPLFVESTTQVNLDRGFAVSPDGSRFLVVREWVPHGEQSGGLVLVQNWIEEFRR